MSTPEMKKGLTFSDLPTEIRLQIWEHIIRPSVHRISAVSPAPTMHVQASRTLARSTAPARAALAVNRAERALILRHLLPNEMPVFGHNKTKHGVLRFHAAKDIICFVWEVLRRRFISLSIKWWEMGRFKGEGDAGGDQRPAWMSQVQNMAMELAPTERGWHENAPIFASFGLGNHCSWFSGLKQLYVVCEPQDDQLRARFVARTDPDGTVSVVKVDKGYVVKLQKQHVREAFLHTGTYAGRDETHAYVSGAAAIDKLQARRSACTAVSQVFAVNKRRGKQELEGSPDYGLRIDVKVGVLLHTRK
ncbi:hypothetical protein BBK36DRAFT_1169510 [Trichoderma citrinoviride]|uniref:2EXR domain-containing protein n=1 Tax=Trichoderma citrinoviride TaxID=58853 RepID=A0A2T4B908_9HYPO|nr:hypothetical protein BBK36DRAFT_1169510 [Trichoderma citrinoviride]PTB65817.1 hypothetical protein BBK36DRAFT_1169510 [Trichoderma citrinoviride]